MRVGQVELGALLLTNIGCRGSDSLRSIEPTFRNAPTVWQTICYYSAGGSIPSSDKMHIEGSPSVVLNAGRQKLYGNVGLRIIEANIQELLRAADGDQASWC